MLQRLSLPLVLLCMMAGVARAQDAALVKQGRALADQGRYAEAIDLLEPVLERNLNRNDDESTDYYRKFSDALPVLTSLSEYMAALYIKAGLAERGADFMNRLYMSLKESKKPRSRELEEPLIDVAIAARRFDLATAMVDAQKKREDYWGWDLTYARIYAAAGRPAEAIAKLGSYLANDAADSRNRILARPEFTVLYGDPTFRELMTETREGVRRRRERFGFSSNQEAPAAPLDEVLDAARIYAQVKDEESGRELNERLKAADPVVGSQAGRYREQLFASLVEKKESSYYRLTIGAMLAGLEDTALTRRVAAEVAGDDFLMFPKQLFRLTYLIARTDPEAARPLLRQMLKGSKGSIFIAQHFMTLNWDNMLAQAFGVAGPAAIDDLASAAAGSDTVMSGNATRLLAGFNDPRLVDVLMRKIEASPSPDERRRFIDRLSSIYLPQSVAALQALQAKGGTPGEMLAVRVSLKSLKPPVAEPFADKSGIAITDPAVKAILFRNLELTNGIDVSYIEKTILLSSTAADIPALQRVRGSILFRVSDEALYDVRSIDAIITWLRWKG